MSEQTIGDVAAETTCRRARILVVDDEPSILQAYRLILRSAQDPETLAVSMANSALTVDKDPSAEQLLVMGWRYELVLCSEAEPAVACVERAIQAGDPFAMAFFDVRMPPGPTGGLWAAEQVRALDGDLAIVIVTGGSDVDSRELVQRIPPADLLFYIQKPFHPRELVQFVIALGARWQAEKMLRQANDDLEQKVEDRTRELAKANTRLRSEVEERQRAEELIRASLSEKEVLLKEIHHRVKNNLQVTSSLLRLQSRFAKGDMDYAEVLRESENRIRSMALIHEVLYESDNLSSIDVRDYVTRLTNQLSRSYGVSASKVRINVDAESLLLPLDLAVPCGLIVNELVTNAFKYAFPDSRRGTIDVMVRRLADDKVQLEVRDDGVGIPPDVDLNTSTSLGLRLVRMLSEDQLQGTVEIGRDAGTSFVITFEATE